MGTIRPPTSVASPGLRRNGIPDTPRLSVGKPADIVGKRDGTGRSLIQGFFLAVILMSALLPAGCRTTPFPPANLSEPGWTIRQGQAVWRPGRGKPEIAGELLVAQNRDGRSLTQLTKTPFPLLTAQSDSTRWRIEFPPRGKSFAGPGRPPARLVWLRLAPILFDHTPPPKDWRLDQASANHFRLEHKSSGEFIEGFLNP